MFLVSCLRILRQRFSSKSSIVLCFTFRLIIHLESIFELSGAWWVGRGHLHIQIGWHCQQDFTSQCLQHHVGRRHGFLCPVHLQQNGFCQKGSVLQSCPLPNPRENWPAMVGLLLSAFLGCGLSQHLSYEAKQTNVQRTPCQVTP